MNKDSLFIGLQHCIPQHGLSRLFGLFAQRRIPFLTPYAIRSFIRHYGVDMSLAEEPRSENYDTFNAFFTRSIRPEVRPICPDPHHLACPVDGAISQIGAIEGERIFQAKGHHFDLPALMGNLHTLASPFENGHFTTIYLSPKDYHRIHMPLDGQLRHMIHVPGRLFSVNPVTVANVDGLFARNERVIAIFDTQLGPMAVVFVGATIVGSIETVWSGTVTPPGAKTVHHWQYDEQTSLHYKKGDEIGRFKLGSTVILLFPHNTLAWQPSLAEGSDVIMGQAIGQTMEQALTEKVATVPVD